MQRATDEVVGMVLVHPSRTGVLDRGFQTSPAWPLVPAVRWMVMRPSEAGYSKRRLPRLRPAQRRPNKCMRMLLAEPLGCTYVVTLLSATCIVAAYLDRANGPSRRRCSLLLANQAHAYIAVECPKAHR